MLKNVIFAITFLLAFTIAVHAVEKDGPILTLEKDAVDYGVVYVDDLPETEIAIRFKNTGNSPLILTSARSCCATRVSDWPKNPIMPGMEGLIHVDFYLAPRPQQIDREIIISSNSIDQQSHVFRIKGEVKRKPSEDEK